MKLHSFITLSAALLATPGLAQPSASNDALCPATEPNIIGGDPCSVADGSDCNYGTFTWPGSNQETSALMCTCFGGSFFCAENAIPSIDPRNSNDCPADTPSSGDMCSTASSEDCQYQTNGVVTRCTCFDNSFSCNQPLESADPDNHPACPATQPLITGGEPCSNPDGDDCKYGEFFWPGSDEATFASLCTCFGGTFACAVPSQPASSDPSNDGTCPASIPSLGDSCSTPGDQDCQYQEAGEVYRCTCFDGEFACAIPSAGQDDASPINHPECPADEPQIGSTCTTPANRDCLYREFYWPGSQDVTYIGRCSCFDGIFQCAEQSVPATDPSNDATCPDTTPKDGDSCAAAIAGADKVCQYSGGELVVRCECLADETFDCSDAVKPSASPDNDASCPAIEPSNMDPCITPSDKDCFYEELVCPNGDDAGYLVFFTCMNGAYVLGVTDKFCTPAFCFAGDSSVQVQDRGVTPMKDLQIGDKVNVGNDKFEPVYSFGHYNPVVHGRFLEVKTDQSSLQVSADHMVFAASRGFVPASTLQKGDKLVLGSRDEVVVESIRPVKSKGVFAPFTPSGKIVVDDVLASSFVVLKSQPTISFAGFTVSYQWLAHTFEFPHRVVCHYLTKCPTESYTSDGISTWAAAPLKAAQWVLSQNAALVGALMVPFVLMLCIFAILEACFLYPVAVVALGVAFGAAMRQSKKMKSL